MNRPLWPYKPHITPPAEIEKHPNAFDNSSELVGYIHTRHPYIPEGCTQQGRIEPAHAASEYDDHPCAAVASTWVWWLPLAIPAVGIGALALVAVYWDDLQSVLRGWLS